MAKKQSSRRFVTQIIYSNQGDIHVVGYIGDFWKKACFSGKYRWSKDGKRWSKKWLGYDSAIRALLVKTGHSEHDDKHIYPVPETYKQKWLDPN
ncbi:MAG: hypothetical protein KJO91_10875 [Gammaproteobacteria bacterium]|nr:hypothetical protein [Gammaproteobacteria bacterium]